MAYKNYIAPHILVNNGSDGRLPPVMYQAKNWTVVGILRITPLGIISLII